MKVVKGLVFDALLEGVYVYDQFDKVKIKSDIKVIPVVGLKAGKWILGFTVPKTANFENILNIAKDRNTVIKAFCSLYLKPNFVIIERELSQEVQDKVREIIVEELENFIADYYNQLDIVINKILNNDLDF